MVQASELQSGEAGDDIALPEAPWAPEAIRQTARRMIDADLPPATRISCALRLAEAGAAEEALAVILADPATFGSAEAVPVLDAVVNRRDLPRPVAALAWHLRRRLSRMAPPGPS